MRIKVIIIISILILTSVDTFSKCAEKALSVWPFTTELTPTPRLIVSASLGMQEFAIDSLEKYPIIFVSESDTVEIKLGEAFINEFNETQYVATVARPLIVGEKYQVEIYTFERYPKHYRRQFLVNIDPWEHEWLIVEKIGLELPKFVANPKKITGTYHTPSCGPESFDTYTIETNNNDFNIVEVNVKRGDYKLKTLSHIENGTINVGFGMCTGQYLFKEAEEYDISFTLININGQRSDTKYLKNIVSPKWDVETEPKMYMK